MKCFQYNHCIVLLASLLIAQHTAIAAEELVPREYTEDEGIVERWTEKKKPDGTYVKHGKYIETLSNGSKYIEGVYTDGLKTGIWTTYYGTVDNQKKSEIEFSNDKREGLYIEWHQNGERAIEQRFENDLLEGTAISWYPSGIKKSEGTYKKGKLIGKFYTWFDDGNKESELMYVDGKLNGLQIQWHRNGVKMLESQYENGERHGKASLWDENGTILRDEFYERGKLIKKENSKTGP